MDQNGPKRWIKKLTLAGHQVLVLFVAFTAGHVGRYALPKFTQSTQAFLNKLGCRTRGHIVLFVLASLPQSHIGRIVADEPEKVFTVSLVG